ncbi:MAG: hypothetical protein IPI29_06615 [Ignavibacteria bacterium]|nr:hypothetical protein [Ignavibacteria bacterium]
MEIVANDKSILEPLFFTDTTHFSAPIVRFNQNIRSEAGVQRWDIIARQGNKDLKTFADQVQMSNLRWIGILAVNWDRSCF